MADDLLNGVIEVKPNPKSPVQQSSEMRRLSRDVDRTIDNNGAVTLPTFGPGPKSSRKLAWVLGAAVIGSALLFKRARP